MKKLKKEQIELMAAFQQITGVPAMDCITSEKVYFLVPEGSAAIAVGKGGANVKKLASSIGKSVKIFEFSPHQERFVLNLVESAEQITIKGDKAKAKVKTELRGKIIGKMGKNLSALQKLLKRNSSLRSLKIYSGPGGI